MRFFGLAGLVMILSGLGAYYIARSDDLPLFSVLNLLGGLALVCAGGIIELRRFRGFSGVRSRRVVVRWSAIGLAVLGAVLGANALARGWHASLDLSANRIYTLSEQTLEVCARAARLPPAERPRLLLLKDALLASDFRLLLETYAHLCPALEFEEVLSADVPAAALPVVERIEVTVLACRPGRCEGSGFPTEVNITNALVRVLLDRTIEIHFLIGHGEGNLASATPTGYAGLAALLREEGHQLEALVGPASGAISTDVDVLALIAPARDLLAAEVESLETYLNDGGRLLVLLEPGIQTNLTKLLEAWGFGLPNAIILDRQGSALLPDPRPLSLLIHAYSAYHPITRKLTNRSMILAPGVRPVLPRRKPQPGDELKALAFSSRSAWLESDVAQVFSGRPVPENPPQESQGELPLAVAGRYARASGETRIVVIGDADFASNRLLGDLYNRDLILNAVLWLGEQEGGSPRPKVWTPDQDPFTIQQTLAYFYFMAFALPELLLLLGIRAWYRQRRS